jgi:hypothetical protein
VGDEDLEIPIKLLDWGKRCRWSSLVQVKGFGHARYFFKRSDGWDELKLLTKDNPWVQARKISQKWIYRAGLKV